MLTAKDQAVGVREVRVSPDDSARVRDLLASNRTLLAWDRTAIVFAGLGFAVARFGLAREDARLSACLGIVMVLVALLMAVVDYTQHHRMLLQEIAPPGSPQPVEWPSLVATGCCVVICIVLIPYLAVVAI
jgi:uncharacterized membrane protein YidH (DUF202 family)